ncbi:MULTISPECIES: Fur family transcriptional regulator [Bacillaceae]|uniref:Transcriptional repressor n=1 Tax=Gottfriedia luciferensis TaxID=178774 RepID=A0ABX2ZRP7_9BACI|nr:MULTISPECIES: Fur family transcriptional regulator [Bacillaceae]QKE71498.1 transcriptional repressor [Arthrobacter citreus]ODG91375.1 transcriptional repressor [Gottfriedia luciferensis]PEC51190.1 transcriptional repressor [Bacillus sp. AFS096315]PET63802.1 transcriptional repressor [Bacillus sp. AFS001701]PFH84858.1 transcriptional repressor [Bacillus sp. AFS088145]
MKLADASKLLKERGFKNTPKRYDMLEYIFRQNKYVTARDIQQALKDKYKGLSFDTIYRNLSTFIEVDVVEVTELDGEKRFRSKCSSSEHHHHFICLDCGNTKSIYRCPMDNLSVDLPGYTVQSHKFEIYGLCPECS